MAVRQLTRLTLATDDAAQAAGLSIMQGVTCSYDLLAIQPLSERVLQQVATLTRKTLIFKNLNVNLQLPLA